MIILIPSINKGINVLIFPLLLAMNNIMVKIKSKG